MPGANADPFIHKLLDMLARSRAIELALIEALTDAERANTGSADRWVVKDHVSHLAAWKRHAAQTLVAAVRGERPERIDNHQAFNARTFEAQRISPWPAVLAAADRAAGELVASVRACAEADLVDPARFPWRGGVPLAMLVVGNGYLHPVEHYAQCHVERGDLASAQAVAQSVVATMEQLVPETLYHADALYNLGCYYARSGQPARAVRAVGEALVMRPELAEWSRQDPDLAGLRDDPGFLALATR